MGIFNKDKKIVAYAVITKQIKNKFLTITKNTFEAYEYVMLLLKLQHQCHFDSWCLTRKLDKDNPNNWLVYYENCIEDEEKDNFQIIKIKYHIRDVLAILRMFGNCFPLGCSFDTDVERLYFKTILNDRSSQEAENNNLEKNIDVEENNLNEH